VSTWRILVGDTRDRLADLPAASVQCCVTSPPYWGLRDYGHAGQLGLEPTPDAYVAEMVEVFRGVRRVLRDDATCWINLGDSYASSTGPRTITPQTAYATGRAGGNARGPASKTLGYEKADGGFRDYGSLKPKDLVGIPWRVAFALQADGWYLRSDIIWAKPNPMPESVTDRPTKAHEYLFLLTKSARYYYDAEAIKEASVDMAGWQSRMKYKLSGRPDGATVCPGDSEGQRYAPKGMRAVPDDSAGRNRRSVWTIPTQPYPEAHFATYPEALVEPCILAGSKEGDTVLDPFTGSGTTGAVAARLHRSFVGCELNPAYVELARRRIGNSNPLFVTEAA
jgi:DNA modification methylase